MRLKPLSRRNRDTSHTYDDLGRVTSVTYPTDTAFASTGTSYTNPNDRPAVSAHLTSPGGLIR